MRYLLDTNIISYIVSRDPLVQKRFQQAKANHDRFYISAISLYEVKNWLEYQKIRRKQKIFDRILRRVTIIWIDHATIIDQAVAIHNHLRGNGELIQHQDILIAATAKAHDLTVVTNDSGFERIPHLPLVNWRNA